MSAAAIDLTRRTFGRLTVIERAGSDHGGRACWRCECSCGTSKVISGDSLRSGNTRSCGCLARDLASAKAKRRARPRAGRSRLALFDQFDLVETD